MCAINLARQQRSFQGYLCGEPFECDDDERKSKKPIGRDSLKSLQSQRSVTPLPALTKRQSHPIGFFCKWLLQLLNQAGTPRARSRGRAPAAFLAKPLSPIWVSLFFVLVRQNDNSFVYTASHDHQSWHAFQFRGYIAHYTAGLVQTLVKLARSRLQRYIARHLPPLFLHPFLEWLRCRSLFVLRTLCG